MKHRARSWLMVGVVLMLALAVPAAALAQGDEGTVTHTVQPGESLVRIAEAYGTTVEAIAQANNILNPHLIYVGQVLVIPTGTPEATPTPPEPEATEPAPEPETPEAPPPPGTELTYVVQPGDNLFRIGLRFNLAPSVLAAYNGIPNPAVIYVGQVIRIPPSAATNEPVVVPTVTATGDAPAPQATSTEAEAEEPVPQITPTAVTLPTEMPVPTSTPTPLPTDTPLPTSPPPPTVTPPPTATPAPTEGPAATEVALGDSALTPPPSRSENVGFAYGVVVELTGQDADQINSRVRELGTEWVKQEIVWDAVAPEPDVIDWDALDEMVNALDYAGHNVLLTVHSAPDWAREVTEENGPPADYQDYADFMGALAARYAGRVDAYEVWSEQNLRREWNTPLGISAASYVEMLRLTYIAVKTADPAAIVVSGGLAPTGFNDGINAISDREYLRQMYLAGVADWSDAIGAHPMGWGNPPDSLCCGSQAPDVEGWDDDPSFFFKETLQDYRDIMVQNGDSGTYLWVTKFGWGTNDGLNVNPPEGFEFVTFNSLDEQTQYSIRAFQLGRELGYVGPMFIWNLNHCQVQSVIGIDCLWSLLDPAGNPRPVFLGVRDMNK